MASAFDIADRADRMARRRVVRRIKAIVMRICALFRRSAAPPAPARDRGYDDGTTVTAADIRRAWPHMREICGLVSTSACMHELIRQAVRQARAREAGEKLPPPPRPHRAALFTKEVEYGDRR